MAQEIRKRGTRPRGARTPISLRVPVDHHDVYQQKADALGIPLSSYVAMRMAELEGLDVPAYVQEELRKADVRRFIERTQEELPLAQTA
ncbi:MAG: hypothetical protein DI536_36535 [Archangium gephyra]|uniref:Toxin-antitoxin system n=1 Tax=Archangium gephyra TaxID=48 RepID=A0A2W5UI79_9BACT|nr:MAG: hypothetical protein DI536_36535 [Archangium gephyra]